MVSDVLSKLRGEEEAAGQRRYFRWREGGAGRERRREGSGRVGGGPSWRSGGRVEPWGPVEAGPRQHRRCGLGRAVRGGLRAGRWGGARVRERCWGSRVRLSTMTRSNRGIA